MTHPYGVAPPAPTPVVKPFDFALLQLAPIRAACSKFEPVGSRVTCSPAPTDTDVDYLAFLEDPDRFVEFEHLLYHSGFRLDGSMILRQGCDLSDPDHFQSYKRGEVNLIATASEEFFEAFMLAIKLAKRFNLLQKAERIALFQAVLYQTDVDQ